MPKRAVPYNSWLAGKLADPKLAVSYLNGALGDSPEMFLKALGKVAQANQIAKVAAEAGVQRETLYRSLTEQGNPTLSTLIGVLSALGLRLSIAEATSETAVQNESQAA